MNKLVVLFFVVFVSGCAGGDYEKALESLAETRLVMEETRKQIEEVKQRIKGIRKEEFELGVLAGAVAVQRMLEDDVEGVASGTTYESSKMPVRTRLLAEAYAMRRKWEEEAKEKQ